MQHPRLHFLFSLTILLVGCANAPTEQLISAASGGTVEASSHRLAVPANALGSDTQIVLSTADIGAYPALTNARSEVFVIEPENTRLEVPATVTLLGVRSGADERLSVYQLNDGAWRPTENSSDEEGNLVVPITLFAPLAVASQPVTAESAQIVGTLSWGNGTPAAEAPVNLLFNDAIIADATTGADGSFAFYDLAPGTYVISVDYECTLSETIELSGGEHATPSLTLCGS